MTYTWTDERIEKLASMWADGWSASRLAAALGIARNAVIGKVHRLRLSGDKPPSPEPRISRNQYDHDAILDRWLAGANQSDIADAIGTTKHTINQIVCAARKRGDPRAVYHGRHVSGRPRRSPGRSSLANKIASGTFAPRLRAQREPEPVYVPYTGPRYGILDDQLTRHMCRAIVEGRGPTTLFCSAPTVNDSQFQFCREHAATYLTTPTGRTWTPQQRQKYALSMLRRATEVAA